MMNKEQENYGLKIIKQVKLQSSDQNSFRNMLPASSGDNIVKEFIKGVREVRGPIIMESGAEYEGEWLNGLRDGSGS